MTKPRDDKTVFGDIFDIISCCYFWKAKFSSMQNSSGAFFFNSWQWVNFERTFCQRNVSVP